MIDLADVREGDLIRGPSGQTYRVLEVLLHGVRVLCYEYPQERTRDVAQCLTIDGALLQKFSKVSEEF